MLACDCQGQWLYRCYSVWGDCYFRCGGIFIVIFYLVVMTVDIPGCLACWSVNVMSEVLFLVQSKRNLLLFNSVLSL